MAKLIPARSSSLPRMTGGEKRLSERLERKLENDYLIWYDVPVGPKQLHPDFVIVHPRRGLLVLEVKDWKLETIQKVDRNSFTLLTDRGLVTEKNPLMQARVYALEVAVTLESDPALRQEAGNRYAGKLCMPYGWGAVLANITRKQFEASGLEQVLEPGRVICQDEMLESVEPDVFQQRLWDMFSQVFPCTLTLPQLDRIRWHLFPEIRVATGANQFGLFDTTGVPSPGPVKIPDLIRVMDFNQELLARSLGDGHRVIHGVAGSGKTMILGYRCVNLAKALTKPILVLCYNVALAARLRQIIDSHGLSEQVRVRSFHAWCREMLTTYHIDPPKGRANDALFKRMVEATIAGVDNGQIPRAQYGAVMIDEGHDFEPEWFKLVVQMVDPVSNSMLVLYDDAQAIYGKNRKKFSFSSVGIQAKGRRTTILKLNYRNTLEVLSVARAFAKDLLTEADAEEDGVPTIAPESAGRRGRLPELIERPSLAEEAKLIASRVQEEVAEGRGLSDMGILYSDAAVADAVQHQLSRLGIPFRAARTADDKRALFEGAPSVKLVSLYSSKGLEFGTVYVPALGELPESEDEITDQARLLYVAMTRSTERLVMSFHKGSGLVDRMRQAIGEVEQGLR